VIETLVEYRGNDTFFIVPGESGKDIIDQASEAYADVRDYGTFYSNSYSTDTVMGVGERSIFFWCYDGAAVTAHSIASSASAASLTLR
jgi:hypothetical protein